MRGAKFIVRRRGRPPVAALGPRPGAMRKSSEMPKVVVQKELCKGCGLCVDACPTKNLAMGQRVNAQGYAYVVWDKKAKCTGCAICGRLCPDIALRIYKEERK